jgi:hypothetical protein
MKLKKNIILVLLMLFFGVSFAQVGIGTLTPAATSVLDISSTTKGILLPRMSTTQINAMGTTITKGVLVYNLDDLAFNTFDTSWKDFSTGYKTVSSTLATTTASISDVLVSDMVLHPSAGTYVVSFTSQFNNLAPSPAIALATFSVYANGILIPDSVRKLTSLVTAAPVSLQTIATVTSGQTIEIRWNIDTALSTLSLGNRILTITKVKSN